MYTPQRGIAAIIRAKIAVITAWCWSAHAYSEVAGVIARTRVAIIACGGVVAVQAPRGRVAGVVGAKIAIRAV